MNLWRIILLSVLLGMTMNSHAHEQHQVQQQVQQAIIKMVNSIDSKDWNLATERFTEEVFVDYSSMTGQAGNTVKAEDLVGGWEGLLADVSTHHMLTNFDITIAGEAAEAWSHVYASHEAEGVEYWDIYGRYQHKLQKTPEGWQINFMKLIVHGQRGNRDFLKQVSEQTQ